MAAGLLPLPRKHCPGIIKEAQASTFGRAQVRNIGCAACQSSNLHLPYGRKPTQKPPTQHENGNNSHSNKPVKSKIKHTTELSETKAKVHVHATYSAQNCAFRTKTGPQRKSHLDIQLIFELHLTQYTALERKKKPQTKVTKTAIQHACTHTQRQTQSTFRFAPY